MPSHIDPIYLKNKWSKIVTEGKIKFLFMGTISPESGIDVLLSAYDSLYTQQSNVELVIITIGSYNTASSKQLKLRIENRELAKVTWIPRESDLDPSEFIELMQRFDYFIAPYRADSYMYHYYRRSAVAYGMPVALTSSGPSEEYFPEAVGFTILSETTGCNRSACELTSNTVF